MGIEMLRRISLCIGVCAALALHFGIIARAAAQEVPRPHTGRPAALDASQGQYAVIAPIFAEGPTGNTSFVRLVNNAGVGSGATFSATTYTISVVGATSGIVYGVASIQVAAHASPQYSIDEILTLANTVPLSNGDTGYALYVRNPDRGTGFMHVIFNGNTGFFENASVCQGYVQADTEAKYLFNIHTSLIGGYPTQIYMHNYASSAVTYRVTVRDARTGAAVGVTDVAMAANSTTSRSVAAFEQLVGWTPTGDQGHANLSFEAIGLDVAPILVSAFVTNRGTLVNMSAICQINEIVDDSGSGAPGQVFDLSIAKIGASGTVSSSPSGLSCGADCTHSFSSGVTVTLTATGTGTTFVGWGGACSGTNFTCDVLMSATKSVTATFANSSGGGSSGGTGSGGTGSGPTFTLTLTKGGTGTGLVSSSPVGIACGATCTQTFAAGTTVLLTASGTAGAQFQGWSGACAGATTSCQVTMNSDKTVTAGFGPFLNVLTVVVTGHGQVNSSPVGIVCGILGSDCAFAYATGGIVSLSAGAAGTFSKFQGWSGPCDSIKANPGDSICSVTMNGSQSVTANFAN